MGLAVELVELLVVVGELEELEESVKSSTPHIGICEVHRSTGWLEL